MAKARARATVTTMRGDFMAENLTQNFAAETLLEIDIEKMGVSIATVFAPMVRERVDFE
jgi:hypothetical protein